MSPQPTAYAGHLIHEQPDREFRSEKRANQAVGTLMVGGGAACVAIALYAPLYRQEPHGEFRILMVGLGLFFLVVGTLTLVWGRGARPYRLYEEGILTPMGQFLPYIEFIDAYLLPPVRTKTPVFLQLTKTDGRAVLIGAPNTKYTIFHTREFEKVSRLVIEGVRVHGRRSGVTWTEGARGVLEAASISRGEIMTALEEAARQSGVTEIDEGFVRRVASDPTIARGFAWRAVRRRAA